MEQELFFDWDDANVAHIDRHQVSPDDIAQVFSNGTTDVQYEIVAGEERWTSVGHNGQLRVLVVVWTMRGESVRVVTAFDAGKPMRQHYFSQQGW